MWRELLTHDMEKANVAVFGIPIDENASIGKGARLAPQTIRNNSEFLPPYTIDGEEITARVFDFGDVDGYSYESVLEKMQSAIKIGFTIVLGGDHSISILSQKAFKETRGGKVGLIHIDAHADICDTYDSSQYSHACVNRRALDNGYLPEDITMIGIRSYERQEVDFLSKNQIDIYTSNDVRRMGTKEVAKRLLEKYTCYDSVYLSFDIDAIDPAYAPGTGTPEAFGLHSVEVLDIILTIIKDLPVEVMDLVEVSPSLDTNFITVWLALKYFLEIFTVVSKKHNK